MVYSSKHLLGIEHLSSTDITAILDLAETYVDLNRKEQKQGGTLTGIILQLLACTIDAK